MMIYESEGFNVRTSFRKVFNLSNALLNSNVVPQVVPRPPLPMPQPTTSPVVAMAVRADLYERSRRMQVSEFEEPYDP